MVALNRRIFFVIGKNPLHRKRAVDNLKSRIFKNNPAGFNLSFFYSKEIEVNSFKKEILNFTLGKERVLIFKDAYDLPPAVKDFLFTHLSKIISLSYIIFEIERNPYALSYDKKFIKDKFFATLVKKASVFKISSSERPLTFEDFRRSFRSGNLAQALHVVSKLFEGQPTKAKSLGMQILGVIVKESSRLRSPIEKRKNFNYLWQADRAIKEKGIDSRLAIEILLAKLFAPLEV